METVHHHIDLDRLEGFAVRGVRRVAVFMGLGLNAAEQPGFKDYELSKLASDKHCLNICLVPDGASDAEIESFKKHFTEWIVSSGLQEVLEHYRLFLCEMHKNALAVFQSRGLGRHLGDFSDVHKKFVDNPGLRNCLDELDSRFGISTEYYGSLCQLYKLRNAITHNFRVVGDRQADVNGDLTVKWKAIEIVGKGADQTDVPLSELWGQKLRSDTELLVYAVDREYSYSKGQKVGLDRHQLAEICLFLRVFCIPSAMTAFRQFLTKHRVEGI